MDIKLKFIMDRQQNQMSNRKMNQIENGISKARSITVSVDRQGYKLPALLKEKVSPGKKKRSDNFDRYYIHPTRRYKIKNENPKSNPQNYQDETFIYKNLHNQNFWNWVHPLDAYQLKSQRNNIGRKINSTVLEKFRQNMNSKASTRVPILVQEILDKSI